MKLFDDVMTENLRDSKLEQQKHYLKGIGAYDAGHLSMFGRVERTVCGLLEQGVAWYVPRQHLSRY